MAKTLPNEEVLDAVIVGAGFSGLYMLHCLRELGLQARVFETAPSVGGTWFWNRYPGARCDIESVEYSYQFSEELAQEWNWSERYSPQAEILAYLNHVADRFELRDDIRLETRVRSAIFDEGENRWRVEFVPADSDSESDPDSKKAEPPKSVSARFCIMATGCLSSRNTPDFPGLEDFQGDFCHTGNWPAEGVDFSGQCVAVIGTGSSAVQSIPIIAEQAAHLTVFQRTPTYTVPAANHPLDPDYIAEVKADYAGLRARASQQPFGSTLTRGDEPESALAASEAERRETYEASWNRGGLFFLGAYRDLLFDDEANATAAKFVEQKIHEIVDDPAIAQKLTPKQTIGCKRLCADSGYYATFNRDNVDLIDVSECAIEAITPTGIQTAEAHYPVDQIVFATGFDAMTGALSKIDIRGSGGLSLQEKWAEGPKTYLGLGIAGFPNLFHMAGPGSPSVLTNMVPSIEQHGRWIRDCIAHLQEAGSTRIEAKIDAEADWVEQVNGIASLTIFPGCNSWYLGANVPGKPRVFMPYFGFPTYVAICDKVAGQGYEGFAIS